MHFIFTLPDVTATRKGQESKTKCVFFRWFLGIIWCYANARSMLLCANKYAHLATWLALLCWYSCVVLCYVMFDCAQISWALTCCAILCYIMLASTGFSFTSHILPIYAFSRAAISNAIFVFSFFAYAYYVYILLLCSGKAMLKCLFPTLLRKTLLRSFQTQRGSCNRSSCAILRDTTCYCRAF